MKNQKGFVLVISVLVLTTLLLIGVYLLSSANSESKISSAQSLATKNYYLAESGVNEMIWKIQKDASTGSAFLNGTLGTSSDINRTSVFGDSKASYKVAARNTVPAEAWITATSTYTIGNTTSQRVVKSYISRASGSYGTWDFGSFAGGRGGQQNGNFTFTGSGTALISNNARLHANQEFKAQKVTVVVNNGSVTASNVINEVAGGVITLNNSFKQAPTTTINMLQIDFDSSSSNSWKNRATATYTAAAFSALANNTTLNGIIYVTGNADIVDKNFTINGVLVASGRIYIKNTAKTVTVNTYLAYGGGLLSKGDVIFDVKNGTTLINGLIYASNNLTITSNNNAFTINGAMLGFDASATVSNQAMTLNYESDNIQAVIDQALNQTSPIIQIDHWEEQY